MISCFELPGVVTFVEVKEVVGLEVKDVVGVGSEKNMRDYQ